MIHAKCQHVIVRLKFEFPITIDISKLALNHFKIINSLNFSNIAFNGWSAWSEWSSCNEDGERIRHRKCLTTNPDINECQGNERDVRSCIPETSNGEYFV